MSIDPINIGGTANDGNGQNLRSGGQVINANFAELNTRTAAAQSKADAAVPTSQKGQPGGVAGLDSAGRVPASQLGTTDTFTEGTVNLWFTAARVRSVVLAGLSTVSAAVVAATDSILVAIGKLQAQVTARAMKGANSDITSLTGLTTPLSVTQGGTGGNTPATAQAALGLGSAAAATLATSVTDQTPGRVLRTGDGGLQGAPIARRTLVDMNSERNTEFFYNDMSTAENPFGVFGSGVHIKYPATGRFFELFAGVNGAATKLFARAAQTGSVINAPVEIYHTGNTTRGSGGALSAASPIVRIANVSESQRLDLCEQSFEMAGDWGVANDEARGAQVLRIAVGEYQVTGTLGLASEGWRTQDPKSPDGGRTLGIVESDQSASGVVTVRLFKQRWILAEDGEMVLGKGSPLDVPLDSWIDLRLDFPEQPWDPEPNN